MTTASNPGKPYTYLAFAYRQSSGSSSPYLLTFVAPATEIRRWAGVPRRQRGEGFQRLDDKGRIGQIEKFFDLSLNQSPTSIVIGSSQSPIVKGSVHVKPILVMTDYQGTNVTEMLAPTTEHRQAPESTGASETTPYASPASEEETQSTPSALASLTRTDPPVLCQVTFTVASDAPIEQLAHEYLSHIENRIAEDPQGDDSDDVQEELESNSSETWQGQAQDGMVQNELDGDENEVLNSEPSADIDDDVSFNGEVASDGDDSLDIRGSNLRKLAKRLQHPVWVRRREADIRDITKPATIIDGQHRVLGASSANETVPFNVVALMDATWAEQVFQFTILNHTAKPLRGEFIAGNAALALTISELDSLRQRLISAGVKVKDVDIFAAVGADSRSPFYDLVSTGDVKSPNKLGYSTMVRLAAVWYDARPLFLQDLLQRLFPSHNRADRLNQWRSGVWQDYFWEYWNAVKNVLTHGEPDLWRPHANQLMITAVLRIIQDNELAYFDGQLNFWQNGVSELDTLRTNTEAVTSYLPQELFTTNWQVSGIQGSATDRQVVNDVISNLIRTRGKWTWRRSKLILKK